MINVIVKFYFLRLETESLFGLSFDLVFFFGIIMIEYKVILSNVKVLILRSISICLFL